MSLLAAAMLGFAGLAPAARGQSAPPSKPPQRSMQPPPAAPAPGHADATSESVGIDSSLNIFSVMCALWASGYNAQSNTDILPPVWRRIAGEMYAQQGPAVEAVRTYYRQHEHQDAAETMSRFISLALITGPPPDFHYLYRHEDLPPDVLEIEDFNDLLSRFYVEANVERYWRQVHRAYATPTELLQAPFTKIVQQTMGYLRETLATNSPRTFTVLIEPLVGTSSNFRNYGDRYFFVLNGDARPPLAELRHSFLHFLIDPLPAKFAATLEPSRPLFQAAQAAPQLPAEFRGDFQAWFGECVIQAVELRLDHLTAEERSQALSTADQQGFVLVRPLVAGLEQFQRSEPAMHYYFPTLAHSINPAAETQRVAAVHFAPAAAEATTSRQQQSEKEIMLERAEKLIAQQDGAGARAAFETILQRWPDTPRATYGLAVAAVLQKDEQRAVTLFTQLTKPPAEGATSPDASIVAWSHVYLGRIHDLEGDRDEALEEYRAALAVDGAPDRARAAAQSGVEKGYQRPKQTGDHPVPPG
jgi:tetratricopeptide (TPR) repeat protein